MASGTHSAPGIAALLPRDGAGSSTRRPTCRRKRQHRHAFFVVTRSSNVRRKFALGDSRLIGNNHHQQTELVELGDGIPCSWRKRELIRRVRRIYRAEFGVISRKGL